MDYAHISLRDLQAQLCWFELCHLFAELLRCYIAGKQLGNQVFVRFGRLRWQNVIPPRDE